MPKKKVSLLDRAKGDLKIAELNLTLGISDDIVMDICAHHCQQCVEKVAKYLILLSGSDYAPEHYTTDYLPELEGDEQVTALIESVATQIDSWATTIRYTSSIKSNVGSVRKVIAVCKELIEIAESRYPDSNEAK